MASLSTRRGEKKRIKRSRLSISAILFLALCGSVLLFVAGIRAMSRHAGTAGKGLKGENNAGREWLMQREHGDHARPPQQNVVKKKSEARKMKTDTGVGGIVAAVAAKPPPTHVGEHGDNYQLAFSTDCSPYQRWQSYLMFHSAMMVGQPGYVTRIASGCTDKEAEDETEWNNLHIKGPMSDKFRLHLTPHFSKVKDENGRETGNDYKFFNKPFGLLHWMEHGEGMGVDESTGKVRNEDAIVILVDPDQILLRPITEDFSDKSNIFLGNTGKRKVEHGAPFAQMYGFGGDWMSKVGHVAGKDSPVARVSKNDARMYYPAGPPYVATARDFYAIAVKWTDYVPAVHNAYPHLLAEMFAYCMAAAHLELPHQIVKSLMVSDTGMGGEGWPLLDEIPGEQMCEFGTNINHADRPLPSVMHFCQRYMLGKYFFGKRRLPKDFLSCQRALLIVPPSDLAIKYGYRIPPPPHKPPGEKKPVDKRKAKREAFMLCAITAKLNDAATFFKEHFCKEGVGNFEKSLDLWHKDW